MKTKLLLLTSLFLMAIFVKPTSSIAQKAKTGWIIEELTDDFGDPTGEVALRYYTSGKFSSPNFVSDKTCYVNIFFLKDYGASFQIVEYGDFYASLYTGVNIDFKVKTGSGEVKVFKFVPRSQGRLFPYNPQNGTDFHEFIELLKKENKLRCFFADFNGRSYSFDINCSGFTKSYNQFLTKNKIDDIKIFDTDFLYKLGD